MPVGVLSGGQKAKLQLAKMLLSGASLLLLDEPTNHLDIQAVEWLEDFLKSYNGAYLVVSHDRYFLDKVTEITLEMDHKTITYYKGNYSRSLELRAEHRLAMEREYEKTQRKSTGLRASSSSSGAGTRPATTSPLPASRSRSTGFPPP